MQRAGMIACTYVASCTGLGTLGGAVLEYNEPRRFATTEQERAWIKMTKLEKFGEDVVDDSIRLVGGAAVGASLGLAFSLASPIVVPLALVRTLRAPEAAPTTFA